MTNFLQNFCFYGFPRLIRRWFDWKVKFLKFTKNCKARSTECRKFGFILQDLRFQFFLEVPRKQKILKFLWNLANASIHTKVVTSVALWSYFCFIFLGSCTFFSAFKTLPYWFQMQKKSLLAFNSQFFLRDWSWFKRWQNTIWLKFIFCERYQQERRKK